MRKILSGEDLIAILGDEARKAGSQRDWAKRHGIAEATVSSVLHGRRKPTLPIRRALGLTPIVMYVREQ